jgi:outer membrane biosynthesis protein TonB
LPWSEEREDQRRFRKTLLVSLLVALCFGILMVLWKLPLRETADVTEIPERLVKLVQRQMPKPPAPKPLEQKKPEDETKPKQKTETQQARAKAEQSGLLAFKSSLADLMDDAAAAKLGADARITNSGQQATGQTQRSLVVAQAREGSGGINTAALSRNGGGTGKKLGGVQFTRVESSVGAGMKDADRPLSSGPGPSRTDEEIQIVFDRYKATLYRIYNRELRTDPTLRGKMVLRMTIEPNGEVSACTIASSDLASDVLKKEVVERVMRFNFGPKENVSRVTILYPIDFLPAS